MHCIWQRASPTLLSIIEIAVMEWGPRPILQTEHHILVDEYPCLHLQVHTFYEAVGYMIQAQADVQVQERLIEKCMSLPNQVRVK